MRVIETERCTLEPQVAAHAEAMFGVLSDPAIYEYENEPPASLDWLRERFTRLESRRSADGREAWLNWVVRTTASGLIGYVQATVHPGGSASIAYEFASAHWGLGLASEAVRGTIGELIDQYRVRSLAAVLKRANHRSRRLLERLGFTVASDEERAARGVADDELLMIRAVACAGWLTE
jgi:[ribosomal protein S5]-alanine N-acetyltransferase